MNNLLTPTVLAATGHRPNKLGGWSKSTNNKLTAFACNYLQKRGNRFDHVISGMAAGWDLAWAEAALLRGLTVWAAVPFPGQESQWNEYEQRRYRDILNQCSIVYEVNGCFELEAYQKRNRWMVDNCGELVALWNGSKGRTANCVKYATDKVSIVNLWNKWSNYD